ncbi:type a von willebrand factor domain protein [Ichthyophthirius multifiliis]|uniref:Midasin n=1 Tax=Ichthyophthirius multifiliis TaxID=5932 RepID=G0QWH3_ICHMU|nr:type a von willebrand factor domain protein [Ichthyophthirius multifiliis]EGR30434.1 type a von willebrand factor domain protein [Ichthyophthirius multifiliis]|eukprot:XP_004032021.1 type a von willebrand factor domain protein [Ichthyophthirius multifiliis]
MKFINKTFIKTKKQEENDNKATELYIETDININEIKQKILENNFLILDGEAGCGKTTIINKISTDFNQKIISLFVDNTTDLKTLIGSYVCTEKIGQFEWKQGPLVKCMQEGLWLLLENVQEASEEVLQGLLKFSKEGKCEILGGNNIISDFKFKIIGCGNFGGGKMDIKRNFVAQNSGNGDIIYNAYSSRLIEKIASCLYFDEPCLLVGDTGCGKTTMAQHVAEQFQKKLFIYNMNQGSDAVDLIGGFKPIDVRLLLKKILVKYIRKFQEIANVQANKAFVDNLSQLFLHKKYSTLMKAMISSFDGIFQKLQKKCLPIQKWEKLHQKIINLYKNKEKIESNLAFHFVEGNLIKAIKEGDWVLIDEINLANNEVLQKILPIIEGRSILLYERGDLKEIKRHSMFRIIGCMNPGNEIGKKELPENIRKKFTEIYVHDIKEREDVQNLVKKKLGSQIAVEISSKIVDLFMEMKYDLNNNIEDGYQRKLHISLRNLARALNYIKQNIGTYGLDRVLYDGLYLGFGTALSQASQGHFQMQIEKTFQISHLKYSEMLNQKQKVIENNPLKVNLYGFILNKGSLKIKKEEECEFLITDMFKKYTIDVLRAISSSDLPVLLEGPTSAGKTSIIKYIAERSGYKCVRVNNHQHTEIEEYIGSYLPDSKGKLVFHEGVLIQSMKEGNWLILDELNLARSEILESLNRLLDDNKEIFVNETQSYVRPHENFRIFATQNPTSYGGRKELSKAFKNRFVQIFFEDIQENDLQQILQKRCTIAPSYCKKLMAILKDLRLFRQRNNFFLGKESSITIRDLIKWGNRPVLTVDELAMEGYCLLAERLRTQEERDFIQKIIEKHCRVKLNPQIYYQKFSDDMLKPLQSQFPFFLQLNEGFKRMACLTLKCLQNKEPVLLIGETGCGKTTLAQLAGFLRNSKVFSINCHQYTESSDFLGSLRPVRKKEIYEEQLRVFLEQELDQELIEEQYKFLNNQQISIDERVKIIKNEQKRQKLQELFIKSETMFEWQNGPLVESMEQGGVFLIDEISLAEDSVLERLNSVLENERFLLLPEKNESEQIQAKEEFVIISTMNPGGDFGKRELSPALRNRFTEIWVESLTSKNLICSLQGRNDVLEMIKVYLTDCGFNINNSENVAEKIYDFVKFYNSDFCDMYALEAKRNITMRDIVSMMQFMNKTQTFCPNNIYQLYFYALNVVVLEPIKFLPLNENQKKKMIFECLNFVEQQNIGNSLNNNNNNNLISIIDNNKLKMGDFEIPLKNSNFISSKKNIKYSLQNSQTKQTLYKIIQALQLDKSILLEGNPGVGKSSIIEYIAHLTGNKLATICLSEQTDIVDLLGSDLPHCENKLQMKFRWYDGVLLDALKNGYWILLEELNLASQSVLEGLNAILDHRGSVFIPEINQEFKKHPEFRIFAVQNPMGLGGGRKGLPIIFNVYKDVVPEENIKVYNPIVRLLQQIQQLLNLEIFENNAVLQNLAILCDFTLENSIYTTPLNKMITGLQYIAEKCEEWNISSSKQYTLSVQTQPIIDLLLYWRGLERKCWKQMLQEKEKEVENLDVVVFMKLRNLLISAQQKDQENVFNLLDQYVRTSVMGTFSLRMKALYYLTQQKDLLHIKIIFQVYKYYEQFLETFNKTIDENKQEYEKECKDYINLAGWESKNYLTLKQTVEKFQGKLHRILKKYKGFLQEPISRHIFDKQRNNFFAQNYDNFYQKYQIQYKNQRLNNFALSFKNCVNLNENKLVQTTQRLCIKNSLLIPQFQNNNNNNNFYQQINDLNDNNIDIPSWLYIEESIIDVFDRIKCLHGEDVTRNMKYKAVIDYFKFLKTLGFTSYYKTTTQIMKDNTLLYDMKVINSENFHILGLQEDFTYIEKCYYNTLDKICILKFNNQYSEDLTMDNIKRGSGFLIEFFYYIKRSFVNLADLSEKIIPLEQFFNNFCQFEDDICIQVDDYVSINEKVSEILNDCSFLFSNVKNYYSQNDEEDEILKKCEQFTEESVNILNGKIIQVKKYEKIIQNMTLLVEKIQKSKQKTNKYVLLDSQKVLKDKFNEKIKEINALIVYLQDILQQKIQQCIQKNQKSVNDEQIIINDIQLFAQKIFKTVQKYKQILKSNIQVEEEEQQQQEEQKIEKKQNLENNDASFIQNEEKTMQKLKKIFDDFSYKLKEVHSQSLIKKALKKQDSQNLKEILYLLKIYIQNILIYYSKSIKSQSKLLELTSVIFYNLFYKGFCQPKNNNGDQEGETDDEEGKYEFKEGTGIGEGKGKENVTKEIEFEEQLLGNKDDDYQENSESNEQEEEQNKENKEDEFEMDQDFKGKNSKMDNELDEKEQEKAENQADEQFSDVDDDNLDFKMWEGDDAQEEEDKKNDENKQNRKQDQLQFNSKQKPQGELEDKAKDESKKDKEQQRNIKDFENVEQKENPEPEINQMQKNDDEEQEEEQNGENKDLNQQLDPELLKGQMELEEEEELNDEHQDGGSQQGELEEDMESANDQQNDQQQIDPLDQISDFEEKNQQQQEEKTQMEQAVQNENMDEEEEEHNEQIAEEEEEQKKDFPKNVHNQNQKKKNIQEDKYGTEGNDDQIQNQNEKKDQKTEKNQINQNNQENQEENKENQQEQNNEGQQLENINKFSNEFLKQIIQNSQPTAQTLQNFFKDLQIVQESNENQIQQINQEEKLQNQPQNEYEAYNPDQNMSQDQLSQLLKTNFNAQNNQQNIQTQQEDQNNIEEFPNNQTNLKQDLEKEEQQQKQTQKKPENKNNQQQQQKESQIDFEEEQKESQKNKPAKTQYEEDQNIYKEKKPLDLQQSIPKPTKMEQEDNLELQQDIQELLEKYLEDIKSTSEDLPDDLRLQKAQELWQILETQARYLSQQLCEELKVVLEPTQIQSFKGDYKSGKRLNMKKIIPYIASNFRKDKIWLRRSQPSKRTYQILLAIDDSMSMQHQNVGFFALQSMTTLSLAMSKMEVGQIGIAAIKQGLNLLHDFNKQLTPADSPYILSAFQFQHQDHSSNDMDLVKFMDQTIQLFESSKQGQKDIHQICFIMSDGRFNKKLVKPLVAKGEENGILFVFIVLDSSEEKESIMNIKSTNHKYINGKLQIEMKNYLEDFPFKNYIIVKFITKVVQLNGQEASTAEEAEEIAIKLSQNKPKNEGIQFMDYVVKAQIHAGGRGKGFFKENGIQGGVQFAFSPEEVKEISAKMLGNTLITKQTGLRGRPVNKVLITEKMFLRKELYLAITLDRKQGGITIITNERGGMNVEQSGVETVKTHFVQIDKGLTEEILHEVSQSLNIGQKYDEQLHKIVSGLYDCFMKSDCTLLEINPLALSLNGQLVICDQKMIIDDNALFRQIELAQSEDITQKDIKEIEADKNNLNYIALDGNIGCMVNGAGLAMATMDIIQQNNGMPANFLDIGGGANDRQVCNALRLMENDKNVESIFINIFAGINRCDIVVLGLIKALSDLGMKKPIVIRLKGTNLEEGKRLIMESGFQMNLTEDFGKAAQKSVKMAEILRMAKEARININLLS